MKDDTINATAEKNRELIFGTTGATRRECMIVGRLSRPIRGVVSVPSHNLCDLWVWTDQPGRSTQDVVWRINLRDADALEQLAAAGVEFAETEAAFSVAIEVLQRASDSDAAVARAGKVPRD